MQIDLNADVGEGCAADADLLALVTSANVACGFHAGDPATAVATLRLAQANGVQCGAHPSFPDREHFGRREMPRTEQQIWEDCIYQIGALSALAQATGCSLSHVKPHGAIYNLACRDDAYARPVVEAASWFRLPVLGLPNSRLQKLCSGKCGFVAEGFADRRYQADGSLVPRTQVDACITDADEAARQALWLIQEHGIQTLCVHGDNPQVLALCRVVRDAVLRAGYTIRPFAVP